MSLWLQFPLVIGCGFAINGVISWVFNRPGFEEFFEHQLIPPIKGAFILAVLWVFLVNKDLHTLSGLAGFLYNP